MSAGIVDGDAAPVTILVMGVDARPGEAIDVGVRPDVLMLVRLDPAVGRCRLLSIPRDTRTELPGYGLSKVNHALAVGGIPYELLVLQKMLGIPIDHYALINFEGFRTLVDVVGGIPIDVPETVARDGVTVEAGQRHLTGEQALAYARYRDFRTEGDIGRIQRQWELLRGLGTTASERNLLGDLDSILPAVEEHIRSDLGASDMAAIGQTYGGSCTVDTVDPHALVGTRQKLMDPILKQRLYYNVVDQAAIDESIAFLLGP